MYDAIACEYGLTPKEFLEGFTPRQLQMTSKMLNDRTHNKHATNCILHGHDAKYINTEAEEMVRIMEAKRGNNKS